MYGFGASWVDPGAGNDSRQENHAAATTNNTRNPVRFTVPVMVIRSAPVEDKEPVKTLWVSAGLAVRIR